MKRARPSAPSKKLTLKDVDDIDSMIDGSACFDFVEGGWFEWLHVRKGFTGDERMPDSTDSWSGAPLWFYLMAQSRKALHDWYRILPFCNVHSLDGFGRNALFYCINMPDAIPHLLRAGVDPTHFDHRGSRVLHLFLSYYYFRTGPPTSLWMIFDCYMQKHPHLLQEFLASRPPDGYTDLVRFYMEQTRQRHASCRSAALALFGTCYLRLAVPRDMATLLAQWVWSTRWERHVWAPIEDNK